MYIVDMASESIPVAPLTAAVFSILFSLAGGEKHGYQIMKDARSPEGGGVRLGPGTLYGSLERMTRDGLVAETGVSGDERRRFYRLTSFGRCVLGIELDRLRALVESANSMSMLTHAD
jgi:DNA-binding PadR family transcriptional regulator